MVNVLGFELNPAVLAVAVFFLVMFFGDLESSSSSYLPFSNAISNTKLNGNVNGNVNLNANVSGDSMDSMGLKSNQESNRLSEMKKQNEMGCPNAMNSMNNSMNFDNSNNGVQAVSNELESNAPVNNMNSNGMNGYGYGNSLNGNNYGGGNNGGGVLMNGNNMGVPGVSPEMNNVDVSNTLNDSREFPPYPNTELNSNDLLPKENSKMFSEIHPNGEGPLDRNFLTSTHYIGVNTVGQSLKNSNQQIRSEPPNPQVPVSPWNNTTITPDINRRQLEIGSDC